MSKFDESGQIIFSLKVSKNYFSQVYGQKCGVNLVKIGYFLGPKWLNITKFVESSQIILSLKVVKNYSSQVYGHKFGENSH